LLFVQGFNFKGTINQGVADGDVVGEGLGKAIGAWVTTGLGVGVALLIVGNGSM